jgi:hypothetical protein
VIKYPQALPEYPSLTGDLPGEPKDINFPMLAHAVHRGLPEGSVSEFFDHVASGGSLNQKIWMNLYKGYRAMSNPLLFFRKEGLWVVHKETISSPPKDGEYDCFYFHRLRGKPFSVFIRHDGFPPGFVKGQSYCVPW